MERELWSWMTHAAHDVNRSFDESPYHSHSTLLVVRVYLWAVLHDRPTSWACRAEAWDDRTRPRNLPSQSTLSRRLRTARVQRFLDRLGRRLAGRVEAGWTLLKILDGKPLAVARHSKDPDATGGWAAGGVARGYKLHLVYQGNAMPPRFEITPSMSTKETPPAE